MKNKMVKAKDRSYRTTSKGIEILGNLRKIHAALADPEMNSAMINIQHD